MTEIIAVLALAIQPMTRYLYEKGVISISGDKDAIHCTNELFFSLFKRYKVNPDRAGPYAEVFEEMEGVRFFTLIDKEVKE